MMSLYLVEQGMVSLPHLAAPLLHHTLRGALHHPGGVQPGGGELGLYCTVLYCTVPYCTVL